MSVTQYCTFHVDDLLFGVEVARVQEVMLPQAMTPVPLASSAVRGLINLRGTIVTAIDLREQLKLRTCTRDEHMNVVVRTGDDSAVTFMVDEIGDVVDVPSDAEELPPSTLPHAVGALVSKVCKLKNRLLLVLETEKASDVFSAAGAARGDTGGVA